LAEKVPKDRCLNTPAFGLPLLQRRAIDGDFVAELADFLVGDDEDGFVIAEVGVLHRFRGYEADHAKV
jgi:hypothetical protein